jgi:hypothetical protein
MPGIDKIAFNDDKKLNIKNIRCLMIKINYLHHW